MHIIYGLQMVSENVEFSCATDFSQNDKLIT